MKLSAAQPMPIMQSTVEKRAEGAGQSAAGLSISRAWNSFEPRWVSSGFGTRRQAKKLPAKCEWLKGSRSVRGERSGGERRRKNNNKTHSAAKYAEKREPQKEEEEKQQLWTELSWGWGCARGCLCLCVCVWLCVCHSLRVGGNCKSQWDA